MGWAMGHATRSTTYLSQASYVIVSGFRTALGLATYPLGNFIRPRCAERAKPGRGKPGLINPRRPCAARVTVVVPFERYGVKTTKKRWF